MYNTIKNFPKQFLFEPTVENRENLRFSKRVIVGGMGGSHLAADLLQSYLVETDFVVHSDYGLPPFSEDVLSSSLFVASSYSGNTEETIDFFEMAREKGYTVAVIAVGGKLIELAKKYSVPFVQLPDTGIQPRSAIGLSAIAHLELLGDENTMADMRTLATSLNMDDAEETGKKNAADCKGKIPVIYASNKNRTLAYNWKIRLNETGKTPAFYNVFPELNHNEMNGFDLVDALVDYSKRFYFIFLRDNTDHPQILKRMEVTKELYQDRGFEVKDLELEGEFLWHRIFTSIAIADWTAYYIAKNNGADPEQVLMVEELKRRI